MRKTNQRLRMPFTAFWTALMLTASILGAPARMYSQDRDQGRSMVISRYGIVAAESPLAAQAGVRCWSAAETPSMPPSPPTP